MIRTYVNQHHDSQNDDQNLFQPAPWQPEWWSEPISTSTIAVRMMIGTYLNEQHDSQKDDQYHDSQNNDRHNDSQNDDSNLSLQAK